MTLLLWQIMKCKYNSTMEPSDCAVVLLLLQSWCAFSHTSRLSQSQQRVQAPATIAGKGVPPAAAAAAASTRPTPPQDSTAAAAAAAAAPPPAAAAPPAAAVGSGGFPYNPNLHIRTQQATLSQQQAHQPQQQLLQLLKASGAGGSAGSQTPRELAAGAAAPNIGALTPTAAAGGGGGGGGSNANTPTAAAAARLAAATGGGGSGAALSALGSADGAGGSSGSSRQHHHHQQQQQLGAWGVGTGKPTAAAAAAGGGGTPSGQIGQGGQTTPGHMTGVLTGITDPAATLALWSQRRRSVGGYDAPTGAAGVMGTQIAQGASGEWVR